MELWGSCCELPRRSVGEVNSGTLEEQQVLIATELSVPPALVLPVSNLLCDLGHVSSPL